MGLTLNWFIRRSLAKQVRACDVTSLLLHLSLLSFDLFKFFFFLFRFQITIHLYCRNDFCSVVWPPCSLHASSLSLYTSTVSTVTLKWVQWCGFCDTIWNRDGWPSSPKLTRRPGRIATNRSQPAENVNCLHHSLFLSLKIGHLISF